MKNQKALIKTINRGQIAAFVQILYRGLSIGMLLARDKGSFPTPCYIRKRRASVSRSGREWERERENQQYARR